MFLEHRVRKFRFLLFCLLNVVPKFIVSQIPYLKQNRRRCLTTVAFIPITSQSPSESCTMPLLLASFQVCEIQRSSPNRKYKGENYRYFILFMYSFCGGFESPNLTFTEVIPLFYIVSNNKENELFTSSR